MKHVSSAIFVFGMAMLTHFFFVSESLCANYAHDAAGRLLSADYGDGRIVSYSYDAAGNILSIRNQKPADDEDLDGIRDHVEALAPNPVGSSTGDGNGDGTADASQSAVTSLTGYAVSSYLTVASASASVPSFGENGGVQAMARDASLASSATPLGMVRGTFRVAANGDVLVLRVYIPSESRIKNLLAKRRADGAYARVGSTITLLGAKTVLTANFTDGGPYDLDGSVNGRLELVFVPTLSANALPGTTMLLLK